MDYVHLDQFDTAFSSIKGAGSFGRGKIQTVFERLAISQLKEPSVTTLSEKCSAGERLQWTQLSFTGWLKHQGRKKANLLLLASQPIFPLKEKEQSVCVLQRLLVT
ncbi:hypothetical protein Q8A73_021844 [Channa argus]|nr:hypothetical protein Q8A73_021844 [Channa argus]